MIKKYNILTLLVVFAVFLCISTVGNVNAADVPVANFTSDVTNGSTSLNVQFNDTSSGNPNSWYWDFGDGNNSTEQNPVHNYTSTGSYNVSLTVTNIAGNNTISKDGYISVYGSAADNKFSNPGFESGDLSGWTTGSTTSTNNEQSHNGQYSVYFSMGGNQNTNYIQQEIDLTLVDSISFWGYSSGTSPFAVYIDGTQVKMFYTTSNTWKEYTISNLNYVGNHTIMIKWLINSNSFNVDDFSVSISRNMANFTDTTIVDSDKPLTVQFNDSSLGLITNWSWNFGDGTTSTEQNPIHIYAKAGKYTVKLTVTGPYYSSTKTMTNLITVGPTNNRTGEVYDSIQAAIDDAQNGDTINIGSTSYLETYTENVEISKQLNIVAKGNVIINALNTNKPIFNILLSGSGSLIDGFIITGATDSSGIYITPLANVNLTNNTITNNNIGINITGNSTITNNKITNNDIGVNVAGNATITSNTIKNNNIGVNVNSGISNIHFNDIYNNTLYGLKFTGDGVNASNNWWGTNNPTYATSTTAPGKTDIYEAQNGINHVYDPWIVLNVTASDNLLKEGANSTITVDMTHNSNGQGTSDSGNIPDLPVSFYYTLGTLTTTNTTVSKGKANTMVTGGSSSGTANLSATVTGCTVNVSITVDTITPTANIASGTGGTYNTSQTVSLATNDPTAKIYYTTDATNPKTSGTLYTGPVTISQTTTLRFAVIDPAGNWSPVYLQNYVIGTGLANTPWPEYQNNNNHTGQSSYTGPQTNTTKWVINGITVYGSAAIGSDGTIYIGSYEGTLYAFNPDGSLQWTYTPLNSILGSPAIGSDGTIYISDWNSTLYAINPNGTLKWNYTAKWNCTADSHNWGSSPVIGADGTIYIPDDYGIMYAVNPNGTLKWKYNTDSVIYASSAVIGADGTIYIPNENGTLYAINPDGTLKWSFKLCDIGFDYNTPSIGSDGTIYIGNQAGVLFAIKDNGTTGTLKWSYSTGTEESFYGTPAITSNGTIYIVGTNKIYAITSNGNKLWTYSTGGITENDVTSVAIGYNGTIYVGSTTGMYALNPDGTPKWSCNISNICGSPVIGSDGSLYIGTTNGTLYAFNDVTANFAANNTNISSPLTVKFTDKSTGTPQSWSWDFGDGNSSTTQNPTHTYSKAGNYLIILTVTLTNGSNATMAETVLVKSDLTAPTVSSNLNGGLFNTTQNVILNAADNSGSATVYYTTDGSDPRTSSTRYTYTSPIEIDDTTTLIYAAVDSSDNWSPVYNETYTIQPADPVTDIYVQNASYYTNGSLSEEIQSILDNALPGSTIEFLGSEYDDLQLTINKELYLITHSGTKIVTSNSVAVFLINELGAGTTIKGFTIINTGTGAGILINNTNNVTMLSDNVTSTDGTAILVNESTNTTIKNSSVINSSIGINVSNSDNTQINGSNITNNVKRGITIYNSTNAIVDNCILTGNGENSTVGINSDEAAVFIQNSTAVEINNSQVNDNNQGITIKDSTNVTINSNTVLRNYGEGILLSGYVNNITITWNDIEYNCNAIQMDYSSGGNVNIQSNVIANSIADRISQNIEDTGTGINYGAHYSGSTGENIKHNIIMNNEYREIDVHDANGIPPEVGYNWYGFIWVGDNPSAALGSVSEFCCQVRTHGIYLKLVRTGQGTYTAYFMDDEGVVTDLPVNLIITISTPSATHTVQSEGGSASTTFNPNESYGTITATSDKVTITLDSNGRITASGGLDISNLPTTSLSYTGSGNGDGEGDDEGSGTGTSNNPGSVSGSGTGGSSSGSSSGTSSGLAATLGSASALSAAGDAGSSSQGGSTGQSEQTDPSESKTVQELIVDDPTDNTQIWGIIGIIALLILVLGVYYRNDLKNMIRKSKK